MDLNATLIGQFITFALFVWFTMKYVWPPIVKAMQDRKEKIAEGLAAAERSQHELELAQRKAVGILQDAKIQAAEILDQTQQRNSAIIEAAKEQARLEAARIVGLGQSEIERCLQQAKQDLKNQVAILALQSAEKILATRMDQATNDALINQLITEIKL